MANAYKIAVGIQILKGGGGTLYLHDRIILKFILKFSDVLQTSAESRTLLKTVMK